MSRICLCKNCTALLESNSIIEPLENSGNCPLCLGCTSDQIPKQLIAAVIDSLKGETYEVDSFYVVIQVPVNCLLRMALVCKQLGIKNKVTSFELSIRQYLISKVEAGVSDYLKVPCVSMDGQLCIQISLQFADAIQYDHVFLYKNRLVTYDQSISNKFPRVQLDEIYPKLTPKVAETYDWKYVVNIAPTSTDDNLTGTTLAGATFNIDVKSSPVYIAGRYCKFSRNLHQTPWKVEGKCSVTSVEEQICECVTSACKADSYVFSSAGREDVDVRMLGSGRPFLITVNNPRKRVLPLCPSTPHIKVIDWCFVSAENTKVMKMGEQEKEKTYQALCYCPVPIYGDMMELKEKIESLGSVTLDQKTPIRVLHRRGGGSRKRIVSQIKVDLPVPDPRYISVRMCTQAGTYVKEFVSGDFGRTRPSLWELLHTPSPLIVLELDVVDVNLQWPPKLES